MSVYWATCDPGLEDLALEEARHLGTEPEPPVEGSGQVRFTAEDSNAVMSSRSLYHVGDIRLEEDLADKRLSSLIGAVLAVPWPELRARSPFRVTCERKGKHSFSSEEAERAIGAALQRRYGAPVSLREHTCEVRVDLHNTRLRLGRQHTKVSLHRRYQLPFSHPTPIKPTLAWALLTLSGVRAGQRVWDPFCGGGTIAMEAASLPGLKLEVLASDLHDTIVSGARDNAAANRLGERIAFQRSDARDMPTTWGRVDHIVSNLPFGRKVGRGTDLSHLYARFFASAERVLAQRGRIAVLTPKVLLVEEAVRKVEGLQSRSTRRLRNGRICVSMCILERTSEQLGISI